MAGAAMGIGAMCVVLLRLPLTSVLLATLLLSSDGLAVMPLVCAQNVRHGQLVCPAVPPERNTTFISGSPM